MPQDEDMMEMPLVIPRIFYMILLAFGIGFYFIWSAMFNAWTDIAVYTVSVICIGFGLVGTFLYNTLSKEEAAD
jgi:hypothetical protein